LRKSIARLNQESTHWWIRTLLVPSHPGCNANTFSWLMF
jgi:hypothetical protein